MQCTYRVVVIRQEGSKQKVIFDKDWGIIAEGPAQRLDSLALYDLTKPMRKEAKVLRRKLKVA